MKQTKLSQCLLAALMGVIWAGSVGLNNSARAQDITGTNIVALTDFDSNVPGWDYGYFYASGWGPDGAYTNGSGSVDRFYDDSANGGTLCMCYRFTNSPYYDLISTNSGAYYGTGFGAPQMGWGWDPSVFNNLYESNYLFEFDARVEGLADAETTANCQMQCQLTGSGGGTKVLQKNLDFHPGSNWTHFAFTFEDGSYGEKTTWAYFTNHFADAVEVRFNVDLYMPNPQFGWDDYNSVLIDNIQLGIRQISGTPPPPPPIASRTILDWNMDDKPIWAGWGPFQWSQNSYVPTFTSSTSAAGFGVGGSNAWVLQMDNSQLAAPNTPQWAGGGMGNNGPTDYSLFDSGDPKAYLISFDAQATGLNPAKVDPTSCSLQVFLDAPNGNYRIDFPIPAGTNWTSTSYNLSQGSFNIESGRLPKASFSTNYNVTALRIQVQIENASSEADWGFDADNVLAVDNIKLTHNYVACPPLTIEVVGANEVVTWAQPDTGSAKLQSAPALSAPWADVVGATSPHTSAIASGPKYYRTQWVPPATP